MYTGCVVFVLRLPNRPGPSGIFKLINPFSGTKMSTGFSMLAGIIDVAKAANAKKTIDLARVDFSDSPGCLMLRLH